ncbi:MAG: Potassium channel [Alyxoria varia]|nr:MAG: Potassium channel [Alyxoria varia]
MKESVHTAAPPDAPRQDQVKAPKTWGIFRIRSEDDAEEESWWFASTAIPLIAATIGPLANVLSIAAQVSYWRSNLIPGDGDTWDGREALLPELEGIPFPDPPWMLKLNILSLVFGFVGNIFLLANFTNRVRYLVALPVTVVLWYFATALLIAIIVSMNKYFPPQRPIQTYTQGFWYGIIAAVLYLTSSMLLMVNMLGFLLGHYRERFNLTEAQRTMILQTMFFFIWLAGGAGVFSAVESKYGEEGWLYSDALYFCDVTILTVGFGDLAPSHDIGRGLVFPYSVGGIIMLGLVISSLSTFAKEISEEKVIKKRVEAKRTQTVEQSVPKEMGFHPSGARTGKNGTSRNYVSNPYDGRNVPQAAIDDEKLNRHEAESRLGTLSRVAKQTTDAVLSVPPLPRSRKPKEAMLREEKDRFQAMRAIQRSTNNFKLWSALTMSIIAFGLLWCIGALVFYITERETQNLTYFQALYFCYVSLLTIGYGDLAPQSNAGRPVFVVWSLIAVPTMTILVSDLGDTVISKFKRGTNQLADFTLLPKYGMWRGLVAKNAWLFEKLQSWQHQREAKKRLQRGFDTGPNDESGETVAQSIPAVISKEDAPPKSEHELALHLTHAISRAAEHVGNENDKRYSFNEWIEITELIRFTSRGSREEQEDLIEWDWIGEDSPMMAGRSEPEFVLERLCESMRRYAQCRVAEQEVSAVKPNASKSVESSGHDDGDRNDPASPQPSI